MNNDSFIIRGGRSVGGTMTVSGNKNAALPMIAAALLTDEPVTLENLPEIQDVGVMLSVAADLGVKVRRDRLRKSVTLRAERLVRTDIDATMAAKIRTSVLFAGPLLARCGRARLPPPGGDAIGHRRLDTHVAGLCALGAKARMSSRTMTLSGRLKGRRIVLDEASVTATENVLMASVLATGRTEIYNAACEPHVVDLARMLRGMGARIEGEGSNRLVVTGVERLHGCVARIGCDYIEAMSYLVAAAITGGALTLREVDAEPFEILAGTFAKFGVRWTVDAVRRELVYRPGRLRMKYDLGDAIPSIADGPWPAFPSDLMSVLIVLAAKCRGTCLFFEKMFESRLYFVDHLRQLGAKIVQCDPHRVVVTGPAKLVGSTVASPDIRAGIALVIAALAAEGETVIRNASVIDRGYVAVERVLASLGGDAKRQ